MRSVPLLQFNNDDRVSEAVGAIQHQLEQQEETLLAALQSEARAIGISTRARAADSEDSRVPVRLTRGPLGSGLPASQLPAADAAWYSSRENTLLGNIPFELVNFIDGTRTVTEIRNALSAEFEPVSTAAVSRFVNDLVRVGVAEWR